MKNMPFYFLVMVQDVVPLGRKYGIHRIEWTDFSDRFKAYIKWKER